MLKLYRTASLLGFTLALTSCAGGQQLTLSAGLDALAYQTVATYPATPRITAALRRNRSTGTMSVDLLGTTGHVPLPEFQEASLVTALPVEGDQVGIIRGSLPGCPTRYAIVANDSRNLLSTIFGTCGAEYRFVNTPQGLLAVQSGVADPEMWLYDKRRMSGPVRKSVLDARAQAQREASTRSMAAPFTPAQQRAEPALLGRPQPSTNGSPRGPSVDEVSEIRRMSRVGDEALPAPVALHPVQPAAVPTFNPE